MRSLWVLALLLLALAPVHAQEEPAPGAMTITDGTGDTVRVSDAEAAPSVQDAADVDIESLDVVETAQAIDFTLHVADLDASDAAVAGLDFEIAFYHNDQKYVIRTYVSWVAGQDSSSATLFREDAAGVREALSDARGVHDLTTQTLTFSAPRHLLVDTHGAPPVPGFALTQWKVTSESVICINLGVASHCDGYEDAMPDGEAVSDAQLPINLGVRQSGHAQLTSQLPFRYSNGAATTFVYTLQATNNAAFADTFELSSPDLPDGWAIRSQSESVRIDSGRTVDIPVAVQTPFQHKHGETVDFVVEMQSRADPESVGRVLLGVYYPEIAQPGGHHPTLTFHSKNFVDDEFDTAIGLLNDGLGSGGYSQDGSFNTEKAYDSDDGVDVQSQYCEMANSDDRTLGGVFGWTFELEPGLQVGLDFETDGVGTFSVPVKTAAPMLSTGLAGQLVYWPPQDDEFASFYINEPCFSRSQPIMLAETQGFEGATEIGANSQETLTAQLVPTPQSDLVPFEPGSILQLRIQVETARPDNFFLGPKDEPLIAPGGSMTLPLLDYEDPVSAIFGPSGGINLIPRSAQERAVNPGEAILFEVEVRNDGDTRTDIDLSLGGSNQEWATLIGGQSASIGPGQTATRTIAVVAPEDAPDSDRADLILEAQAGDDPSSRALVRVVATVDVDADQVDETEEMMRLLGQEAEEAPGVAPFALLAALAAMATMRRRR